MKDRKSPSIIQTGSLLLVAAILGCSEREPEPAEAVRSSPSECGSHFDPATAGTIRGRVTWRGDIPTVPPFRTSPILPGGIVLSEGPVRENPNAPIIDAKTRGVANAFVFLRGVDAQFARPWDLPPVRAEMQDYQLRIRQGQITSRYGFVRRGDQVEMVSQQPVFHALHADGAAFFGLTFPDTGKPRFRCLDKAGVVELSSAAGYYWMRACLFVDDHPYYARTNAGGRFVLPQVPASEYEVVCWMPDWHEARHDRDPETGVFLRLFFKPAVEQTERVVLGRNETRDINFTFSAIQFGR